MVMGLLAFLCGYCTAFTSQILRHPKPLKLPAPEVLTVLPSILPPTDFHVDPNANGNTSPSNSFHLSLSPDCGRRGGRSRY